MAAKPLPARSVSDFVPTHSLRKTARRQTLQLVSKYVNSAPRVSLLTAEKALYTPHCCKSAGGFAFSSLSELQVRQAASPDYS